MQSVTWSKEEFQASVAAKLALLRAHRQADSGLNLDQRLALAEDRAEFERLRQAAAIKRTALIRPGPTGLIAMKPRDQADNFSMARYEDGESIKSTPADHPDFERTDSFAARPGDHGGARGTSQAKVKPDMTGAIDSYATDFQLKPSVSQPFVPHAQRYRQAMGQSAAPAATTASPVIGVAGDNGFVPDENYTEVPGDRYAAKFADLYKEDVIAETVPAKLLDSDDEKRRRLVEQTKRQSTGQWVVLDRATVLSALAAHPAGLTMVELATKILGASASDRDTRRLSSLMRREEQRKTVRTGGRAKPIVITPTGLHAISTMDVKKESTVAAERRLKRLEAQRHRLLGEKNTTLDKKTAAKAQAKVMRNLARDEKNAEKAAVKAKTATPKEAVAPGQRRYKLGKALPPGMPMKPTGLARKTGTPDPRGVAPANPQLLKKAKKS